MQQISRTMPDKQRRKYDRLLTIRQKQAITKKGESNLQSHPAFGAPSPINTIKQSTHNNKNSLLLHLYRGVLITGIGKYSQHSGLAACIRLGIYYNHGIVIQRDSCSQPWNKYHRHPFQYKVG